jgi:hypothetical protein
VKLRLSPNAAERRVKECRINLKLGLTPKAPDEGPLKLGLTPNAPTKRNTGGGSGA